MNPSPVLTLTAMGAREWLLLIVLSILWGGSFFFNAVALTGLGVFSVVALRVTIAALALHVVRVATGTRLPLETETIKAFIGMALLNNVIPFSLIVYGQTQLASGIAAILNATTPLFTALLAHVMTSDEKLTAPRLAGIVIGFIGVVVLLTGKLDGVSLSSAAPLGVAAALGATLSYAFSGIWGRRFARLGLNPLASATGQVTASSLILLPVAVLTAPGDFLSLPALDICLAMLGIGLLSTALAYLIFFRILAVAGATSISLVTLLIPPSAILLGVLFLGESLPLAAYAGLALIALGLVILDGRLKALLSRLIARRAPAVT